jgi:hypothetical protein
MLAAASAKIRAHCHQDIEATTGRQESFAAEWNRLYIPVTQRPVTAATMTVGGVAFTEFWANYMTGDFYRNDGLFWDEGPILITYDSGFAADSDEMQVVHTICKDAAARALAAPLETFGPEMPELRGTPPGLFLREEEKADLDGLFSLVGVG